MGQFFSVLVELDILLMVCSMPSVTGWILDKLGV